MGPEYRGAPPRSREGKRDPKEIGVLYDLDSYRDRRNGIAPVGCCFWCHSELVPMLCVTVDFRSGDVVSTVKSDQLICPECDDKDTPDF